MKDIERSITKRLRMTIVAIVAFGTVISPVVASAASQSANTTINASIGSAISVSTGSTVAISLTPTSGGIVSSNSDTVTVNTNNAAGYALTLADSDATTDLVSGSDTIGAHAGTQASPTALANNKWGYAVAGVGGFDGSYSAETNNASSASAWAGVPASGSPNQLKSTSSTATNDTTTVWYAVKATSAQPGGTYSDTVTYTATTN